MIYIPVTFPDKHLWKHYTDPWLKASCEHINIFFSYLFLFWAKQFMCWCSSLLQKVAGIFPPQAKAVNVDIVAIGPFWVTTGETVSIHYNAWSCFYLEFQSSILYLTASRPCIPIFCFYSVMNQAAQLKHLLAAVDCRSSAALIAVTWISCGSSCSFQFSWKNFAMVHLFQAPCFIFQVISPPDQHFMQPVSVLYHDPKLAPYVLNPFPNNSGLWIAPLSQWYNTGTCCKSTCMFRDYT